MHVRVKMQDRNGVVDRPFYHHAYESPSEEEERLGSLFNQLDANGDGRIDARDLSEGLKRLNLPQVPGGAEVRPAGGQGTGRRGKAAGVTLMTDWLTWLALGAGFCLTW